MQSAPQPDCRRTDDSRQRNWIDTLNQPCPEQVLGAGSQRRNVVTGLVRLLFLTDAMAAHGDDLGAAGTFVDHPLRRWHLPEGPSDVTTASISARNFSRLVCFLAVVRLEFRESELLATYHFSPVLQPQGQCCVDYLGFPESP